MTFYKVVRVRPAYSGTSPYGYINTITLAEKEMMKEEYDMVADWKAYVWYR